MVEFFWFLLIGVAAGWLSGQITKGSGFGLFGDLMVGVIGAIIGGFVFRLLGLATFRPLGQLISATVGAIILLAILKQVSRRRI